MKNTPFNRENRPESSSHTWQKLMLYTFSALFKNQRMFLLSDNTIQPALQTHRGNAGGAADYLLRDGCRSALASGREAVILHSSKTILHSCKIILNEWAIVADELKIILHSSKTIFNEWAAIADESKIILHSSKTIFNEWAAIADELKNILHSLKIVFNCPKTAAYRLESSPGSDSLIFKPFKYFIYG